MKRVLSGMQPSGKLHIGNLVGALQNWIILQDSYDCYYMVVDWHALTSQYKDTSSLNEYIKDMLINWLAAGLDPQKCTMFIQSQVKEHAELNLLLAMITPLSWLERIPTYKEKREELKDRDLGTYGFLGYPLLQSADILIYNADYVPVGEDQLPHLEIAREIARRFNHFYSKIFTEPQALLTPFPKVVGLDGRKMSKTYGNCIYLSDSSEVVENKIKTMVTDPARVRRKDPGTPELSPVYHLHKIFSSEKEQHEVAQGCQTASIGCIDCKKVLIRNIFTVLEPIWEKRESLIKNPDIIMDIITSGAQQARFKAQEVIEKIREAMNVSVEKLMSSNQ
jgi:tryptophanyl-tRNA synthetase